MNIDIIAKNLAIDPNDKDAIYSRIENDITSVQSWFDEKYEIRRECVDFWAGRQWTEDEIDAHTRQFRYPYTFNEIQHKVNHIVGVQIQTRLDARCIARETGDEAKAELLTYLNKWVEQTNQLEAIETQIFTDAIVGGVGCGVVRWEVEDIENGYIKIERISPDEMFWDITSKKEDLSDARWVARETLISRMDAVEAFPEYIDIIEKASSHSYSRYQNSSHKDKYSTNIGDESRDLLRMVEYYERIKSNMYIVIDTIADKIFKFDVKKDAEDFYDGMIDKYAKNGEQPINPDGSERVMMTSSKVNVIYQTIIIGDDVLFTNPLEINDIPYVMMFCHFYDGDYWGFVDIMISPQILVNRFFSQWDYQVGTAAKNLITIDKRLLEKGMTIDKAAEELSKTAPILPVLNHNAIMMHPNQQANPDLFNAITFGIQRMIDYTGGANALGLQQNAAESGRAVLARAEQGGLSKFPIFDRLRLWRQGIANRVVWWIKNFMPTNQVFRVLGNNDEVKYVTLDDNNLDTLKDIKVDIIIDEMLKSENAKERNFEQLRDLFGQIGGVPMEIALKFLLEYSAIPETKKKELLEHIDYFQSYIKEKSQTAEQEKLQQQVIDSLTKKQMKESMEGSEKLDAQTKQIKQATANMKDEMDKLDKAKQEYGKGGISADEKKKISDSLQTGEELQSAQTSPIVGAMTM